MRSISTLVILASTLAPGSRLLALPPRDAYVKDVQFALSELQAKCGHFFRIKKIDWKKVSARFLREARSVKSHQEHLVLLVRLLARLKDGHASVRPLEKGKDVRWPDDGWNRWTGPGFFLTRSGKKILVKNSGSAAARSGLRPGMELVAVNGVPAARWLAGRIETLSDRLSFSTEQQAFFYACHWGLADLPGTRLRLALKDARGRRASGSLVYSKANVVPDGPAFLPEGLQVGRDIKYGKTEEGWGYIHVRRCPGNLPELTDGALGAIGNVPGMILDFRGNSGGGFDHDAFLGRFIPTGRSIAFNKRYRSAGTDPYGGPLVVIVDGTVRSAGETAAGIFKEDGRAYMIGESATAGMSSSKTTIELPSGLFALYVSIYSNKKRFNGGRGIEGIGVIPHEIVEYTAADLAREVDTLIRRAGELLARFPRSKVPYDPKKFGWKPPPAAAR